MINYELEINGTKYTIPLWTNKTEKEWLLSDDQSLELSNRIDSALNILGVNIEDDVSMYDKLYILVKLREYSYGPQVEEIHSCAVCGNIINISYLLSDTIEYKIGGYSNTIPTDYGIVNLTTNTLNGIPFNSLSADTYIKVKEVISNSNLEEDPFILRYPFRCNSCKSEFLLENDSTDIFNKLVIQTDINNIYNYYVDMKYNYKFSINELDEMMVFERQIYKAKMDEIAQSDAQQPQEGEI